MRLHLAAAVISMAMCFAPVLSRAQPLGFVLGGTFADDGLFGNLPAKDYPYPELFGGSFQGTFTLDRSRPAVRYDEVVDVAEFDYINVSVSIKDRNGRLVHHINSGPNRLSVWEGRMHVNLGHSVEPRSVYKPEDLRLVFDSPLLSPGTMFPPYESFVGASFSHGFIEVDGVQPFTYWDLEVQTAALAPIPEPSTFALAVAGLVALVIVRRRTTAHRS